MSRSSLNTHSSIPHTTKFLIVSRPILDWKKKQWTKRQPTANNYIAFLCISYDYNFFVFDCSVSQGDEYLKSQGISVGNLWYSELALAGMTAVLMISAYIALRLIKKEKWHCCHAICHVTWRTSRTDACRTIQSMSYTKACLHQSSIVIEWSAVFLLHFLFHYNSTII